MIKTAYFRHITSFFLALLIVSFASVSLAKTLNLYDQPVANAKVVSTADSKNGLIVVFTPKNSEWVKVADPTNGNVGWVKSADLGNTGMNFNVISTGDGTKGFQIIQYGGSQHYTAEEAQQAMKQAQQVMEQMHLQQQTIQRDIQQMMQDMMKAMQQQNMTFPMILPIVVVPEKNAAAPASSTPAAKAGAPAAGQSKK